MKPFPVLETDRLVLRGLAPEDEADVFAIHSDPEVTRFFDLVTLTKVAQAAEAIRQFQAEFENGSGIRWGVARKGSPRLIGTCGVSALTRNYSAALGYDLAREYWNQGIMSEAVRAVMAHAFDTLGINRINALTDLNNAASMRVLRKLGFQEEGVLREWGFWQGKFTDVRCFSLLRREWAAAPARV